MIVRILDAIATLWLAAAFILALVVLLALPEKVEGIIDRLDRIEGKIDAFAEEGHP